MTILAPGGCHSGDFAGYDPDPQDVWMAKREETARHWLAQGPGAGRAPAAEALASAARAAIVAQCSPPRAPFRC